jgi:hypothetical protein
MKAIDADYYGYLDDDDNLLVPQEEKIEKECNNIFIYLFINIFSKPP